MFPKKKPIYDNLTIKIRTLLLDGIRDTPFQFIIYPSYWHYRLRKLFKTRMHGGEKHHFIAEKPNYSAGIGHQLANWNTGFYFSRRYDMIFAHFPFSNKIWEHFFGFGEGETAAATLLNDKSYKKVHLPRFNNEKHEQLVLIDNIINSYRNDKVLFLLEQDQEYMEQCGTSSALSGKFLRATARKENKLFYTPGNLNIAIHIRRGDIVAMKQSNSSNWAQRWLNNDYYVHVLDRVLSVFGPSTKTAIYIFSQGKPQDFPEFACFGNINYCLDTNAYDSFLHMVYADILISSKSSFSYKPALLSQGIKICPKDFWHRYPALPEFILADNNGDFEEQQLIVYKRKLEEADG